MNILIKLFYSAMFIAIMIVSYETFKLGKELNMKGQTLSLTLVGIISIISPIIIWFYAK